MSTPSKNLRSRKKKSKKPEKEPQDAPDANEVEPITVVDPASNSWESTDPPSDEPFNARAFSVLDVLRVLGGLILLSCTLSYFITNDSIFWGKRPSFTRPQRIRAWLRGPLNLTPSELALYNGTNTTLPILLALNSTIYDVSASPHLYGPGGSYHFFSGRDATRAFITGCFSGADLTGDLRGVEEMYVAEEFDAEIKAQPGGVMVNKDHRRVWKMERERAWRVARGRVRDGVEGWRRLFDGGKDGRYFAVGRVRGREGRKGGWDWEGERVELCGKAREQRPKKGEREVK